MKRVFTIAVLVDSLIAVIVLHQPIKDFLWTHPWWHSTLVAVPAIALPIIATLELWHSGELVKLNREANRLRDEANRDRKEANDLRRQNLELNREANRLRDDTNKLQDQANGARDDANTLRRQNLELKNALDTERNRHLELIAQHVKPPISVAERNAVKLRKYIGQMVTVNNVGGGTMTTIPQIVEVSDENIVFLFFPKNANLRSAELLMFNCEDVEIVEIPQGSCPLRLAVGKLYGSVVKLGEITRWEDRDKSIDLYPKRLAQSPADAGGGA